MKALAAVSSLVVVLILILVPVHSASGLTYFNPEADECKNEIIKSNNCKKVICEDENVWRNWPTETYYEDCSKYDSFTQHDLFSYGILAAIPLFGLGAFLVWQKRNSS